jgi:DNA-binding LacI/PurR family transcriptional regulator
VSFVLNDTPFQKITDATRQRVLEAASKLGYAPSPAARTLRNGRTDVVLGLLPDWPLGYAIGHLIQEMTIALARRNLTFVVHSSILGTRPLGEIWKALTPAAVLAFDEFSEADAAAMRSAGVQAIVAMHDPVRPTPSESITTGSAVGVVQARHLAASHQRLGYAYPDDHRVAVFADPRLAGERGVCAERGLPEPDVRTVSLAPAAAAEAVRGWLAADPPVTGICAFNDEIAMAVLAGLRLLGLRAPDDLAVVGVDNTLNAALSSPPLTSVVQDFPAIAEFFAETVIAALAGEPAPPEIGEHHTRIEVRESA